MAHLAKIWDLSPKYGHMRVLLKLKKRNGVVSADILQRKKGKVIGSTQRKCRIHLNEAQWEKLMTAMKEYRKSESELKKNSMDLNQIEVFFRLMIILCIYRTSS